MSFSLVEASTTNDDKKENKRRRQEIAPKTGYNLAPFPEFRIDPVVGNIFRYKCNFI